jgi:dihydroflavonol-4-reductase
MILITGANGFLGQHLLRQLAVDNAPIKAMYNSHLPESDLLSLPNVTWIQCDLLDVFAVAEAVEGISEIYHCAGKVSFEAEDHNSIQAINATSTANIVNAALDAGIRKLVHVSSIASLGRSDTDKPLTEEHYWEESKNNTAYARSKYLAEMEVWRGIAEGLNAVIVNPSIILGAGDWQKGSARLMPFADKEFPFYTEGINAWVDVQDVARIMILLMRSTISGERFIVSEGDHSYREIFSLMAQALGKKPPYIKAPHWATGLLWRWNWLRKKISGRAATLTKETTRTASLQCWHDNSKFLKVFPKFRYIPIEDTIREMAKAYKKQQL